MSIFCYKKIEPTEWLGTRLKEAREAAGLSILEVSERTHVPKAYLEAIEQGLFTRLPKAAVFRRAYIKEYAATVGLSESECVTQLIDEAGLSDAATSHPKQQITFSPFATLSIALRNGLLIGVVATFAGYLAWQINGVLRPPTLVLFSPIEGAIITDAATIIEGRTQPEVALAINGEKAAVNGEGHFSTKVDLAPGLNTIVVSATKKHGKTMTRTLHIVAKAKPLTERANKDAALTLQ